MEHELVLNTRVGIFKSWLVEQLKLKFQGINYCVGESWIYFPQSPPSPDDEYLQGLYVKAVEALHDPLIIINPEFHNMLFSELLASDERLSDSHPCDVPRFISIYIKWRLLSDDRIQVRVGFPDNLANQSNIHLALIDAIQSHYPDSKITKTKPDDPTQRRGPTARTFVRFQIFKKYKDAHPEWSQAKVAMESSKELEEIVTADAVRNTYRLMGEKWERADRIR